MQRRHFRLLFAAVFVAAAAFAAWGWLRPYEMRPDPAAGCRIEEAAVTRDHGFYWLDLRLSMNRGETHDLTRPVTLGGGGEALEPAKSTFGESGLWFRFWLDENRLSRPLDLRIGGGSLTVKSTPGVPALADGASRTFQTHRW